ncbi:hypothetical protein ACGFJ4_14610 [Micromonospora chalcea]|uniref:hypothetical protein n=1 Tax=Micromonospora chalcea TaxID=1874 RepID=UPI0034023E17
MATARNAEIPHLDSREAYFDYFDGIAVENKEDAETKKEGGPKKLPGGLLKSYLLETVGPGSPPESLSGIFGRSNLNLETIPDSDVAFRVTDTKRQGIALAEKFSDRYLALYTMLPSQTSDKLVGSSVLMNPMLDHLWLSSQSFHALWQHVRNVNNGRRYGKITFEHEALFAVTDDDLHNESRASRFTMVDRLDEIAGRMEPLQNTYAPLHSIVHLRMPAEGRGGHDVYYDGKVTNRSDSFLDHRNTLQHVVNLYSQLTSNVEKRLWFSGSEPQNPLAATGAVAEIVFGEELSEATFKRWVMTLFNNRKNRFRIGGFHTWLNDRKVHANAIDQHLWQPMMLELTTRRVLAVLPEGTCGNTINRLVSNIQRYVDPNVTAYIGDTNYSDLIPEPSAVRVA